MTTRYTETDARCAVVRLAAALGLAVLLPSSCSRSRGLADRLEVPIASYVLASDGRRLVASADCLRLDYTPCYGGALVVAICAGESGESHPLDDVRLQPREFVVAVNMAIRALDLHATREPV